MIEPGKELCKFFIWIFILSFPGILLPRKYTICTYAKIRKALEHFYMISLNMIHLGYCGAGRQYETASADIKICKAFHLWAQMSGLGPHDVILMKLSRYRSDQSLEWGTSGHETSG